MSTIFQPLSPDVLDWFGPFAREIYLSHYAWAWYDDGLEYARTSFHPDQIRREMAEPGTEFLLIEHNGTPQGFLKTILYKAPNDNFEAAQCLYLERLYLHAEARGLGLGARAVAHAIARAKTAHLSTVWLYCRLEPELMRFYQHMGFVEHQQVQFEQNQIMRAEHRTFALMVLRVDSQ